MFLRALVELLLAILLFRSGGSTSASPTFESYLDFWDGQGYPLLHIKEPEGSPKIISIPTLYPGEKRHEKR